MGDISEPIPIQFGIGITELYFIYCPEYRGYGVHIRLNVPKSMPLGQKFYNKIQIRQDYKWALHLNLENNNKDLSFFLTFV